MKIAISPNEKYSNVFYPYGGFYFYGCHPKHIEPCICRARFEQKDLRIKSYTYSSLLNKNIDVTKIGPRNNKIEFDESPHIGLYEKIKRGEIKIKVKNRDIKNCEKATYKSVAVFNLANTNLITIKFIKEL